MFEFEFFEIIGGGATAPLAPPAPRSLIVAVPDHPGRSSHSRSESWQEQTWRSDERTRPMRAARLMGLNHAEAMLTPRRIKCFVLSHLTTFSTFSLRGFQWRGIIKVH